jgi:hypothetical protein
VAARSAPKPETEGILPGRLKESGVLGVLMSSCTSRLVRALSLLVVCAAWIDVASTQTPNAARPVGTIKSISGNNLILTTDAGSEVTIQVQDGARLLRVEPGQKDLKEAVAMQLQDLIPGDRVLVRGQLSADGKTVLATSVIAMKKADIAQKQTRERDDWQRHGAAGLVSSVDASTNSIVIGMPGTGEKKTVTVHLTKDSILRRYSPDSIKFDDAKPAPLDQIKLGDQIRARGTRSAEGSELTAVEVVSGTFRNLSGRISAVDASTNSITLQDLATKKSVTVKITADSQVRKLPPPMAQRIAARLKGGPPEASAAVAGSGNSAGSGAGINGNPAQAMRPNAAGGAGGQARNASGGGDLQQAISRVPAATLADFQKGDAVMIVATEGAPNGMPSVITLLGGVEAILEASPNSNAATILSPWSLGGEPSGDAGNP